MNYDNAHLNVKRQRGRAAEHPCVTGCGRAAQDWAYQSGSTEELIGRNGRPYSCNPQDYAPMCRSCHFRLDVSKDPRWRARLRHAGEHPSLRARAARSKNMRAINAARRS